MLISDYRLKNIGGIEFGSKKIHKHIHFYRSVELSAYAVSIVGLIIKSV